METFPRLRALGCVVCGDPVSPCPSPACPPELFSEVAPVVYRSVLLSSSHPQLTRQELESKLWTGEIERYQTYPLKDHPRSLEDRHSYGHRGQFPALAGTDSMTVSRRYHLLQKTSPGFFCNLADLQRQLVSGCGARFKGAKSEWSNKLREETEKKQHSRLGHSRWSRPIGRRDQEKSSKTLSGSRREAAQNTKLSSTATYGLFPPVLDVWAQQDAMQRSIALRI